jgi:hypothetical protein
MDAVATWFGSIIPAATRRYGPVFRSWFDNQTRFLQSLMNNLYRTGLLLLVAILVAFGQTSFKRETQKWRQHREADLKAEDGWLTVSGLFWLKEGTTTIGTDSKQVDLVLPANSAPAKVGSLELNKGLVTLRVMDDVEVTVNDKPVREFEVL